MDLQEPDSAEKAGGEDGADAENLFPLVEPAEHLNVHALEGVGAEDGFSGARDDVVGVKGARAEVVALVVAGEYGSGEEPPGRPALRLDEQEVETFALVQSRNVAAAS